MNHCGIPVGWRRISWLLAVACLSTTLGWTQPADAKREEALKRASGLGRAGDTTPTPRPGAPSVSAPGRTKVEAPATREPKPGATAGEAVVTQAYLGAIVRSGDRPTSRPIESPEKKPLPGKSLKLNAPIDGEVYVPSGWKSTGGPIGVIVHFHGAPWVAEQELEKAGINAVLIAVNPGGRGGQYSKAFANPDVFDYILDVALQQLKKEGLAGADAQWGAMTLSAFSAGYGAIREILYTAEYFNRVNALVLADALHASFADESTTGSRAIDEDQMRPFVEFARLAADGKKTLLITRSSILPLYYSGTPETAAYLIHQIDGKEQAVKPPVKDASSMTLIARYDKGNFHVKGYAGAGAADHMEHFHHLALVFNQLPMDKKK